MSIIQITNRDEYESAMNQAYSGKPTVLYVSYSPSPVCKNFTPRYEQLAAESKSTSEEITFYQMEYDKETSPMMKFGPQHMPIVIMILSQRARTLLSPSIAEVTKMMEDIFDAK